MKVLLFQDVRKIGRKGEIVSINDGYARNFILPKKLGRAATAADEKALVHQQKHQEMLHDKQEAAYNVILDTLKEGRVELSAPANPKGGLFSALKEKDVRDAFSQKYSLEIPDELFEYVTPIKETGEHEIIFSYHGRKVSSTLVVTAK